LNITSKAVRHADSRDTALDWLVNGIHVHEFYCKPVGPSRKSNNYGQAIGDRKTVMPTFFQALDRKAREAQPKKISGLAFHLIFHHFSPFV